jgi:hypothetical protein
MKGLSIAVFRFYFNPLEEIRLPPYKGSAFRGGFGKVFKQVVCINCEEDCENCLLQSKCVYSYVFETPACGKGEFNTTHLPHPYVLEPPLDGKSRYLPEDSFSVNLILIGRAIDYLPYFIFVMEEFGKNGIGRGRGRFFLERVETLSHPSDIEGRIIFEGRSKRISGDAEIKAFFGMNRETNYNQFLTINFLTPARITFQNRLNPPLEFCFLIFMKNLLRRIHLLAEHCSSAVEADYKKLLDQAGDIETVDNNLYWYDWERYSKRQDTRMKFGGFKGRITFSGPVSPFLPFIKVGEYVHVGEKTSFGLGKYVIVSDKRKS